MFFRQRDAAIQLTQLRHHLGPLNTVPFGEILTLTNFSRDWVMMKLKLRLTYDTDVELGEGLDGILRFR